MFLFMLGNEIFLHETFRMDVYRHLADDQGLTLVVIYGAFTPGHVILRPDAN